MPGVGSIYHLATGAYVGTIVDGDAAGLANAKIALAGGGLLQMGPGTEGIALGTGWGSIALALIDSTGHLHLSRFIMMDGDDPHKLLAWDLSDIASPATRTVTAPNYSGFLLLPASLGSSGEFLQSAGAGVQPIWASAGVNPLLDGTNHNDTISQTCSRGSLIKGNADATAKWDELVIGAANTVLTSNGTDASWTTPATVAGTLQHDLLLHLKPFSVTNCSWNKNTTTIFHASGGLANVKVGDFIYLGTNTTASTQGARVSALIDSNNVTADLTKSAGDSNLSNVTMIFQPGDHWDNTVALDTGAGGGLFLTLGRGTYVGPTGGATGSTFQELRGPLRWLPHNSGSLVTDFRVQGSATGTAGNESGFGITKAGASPFCAYFYPGALTNTRMYAFPDISGEFTLGGNTQTLTNKTLDTTNKIIMGNANTWTVFQTTGGGGDRLTFDFTGVTTLRVATFPNFDYKTVGSARTTGSFIDLTGQAASIGSTTLLTTPAAGVYRVSVYHVCTTAGAAGTLDTTISWNDGTAARTRTPAPQILLTATNFDEGEVTVRVDGATNIAFTTTYAGAVGAPVYSVFIRVEAI